MAAPPTPTPPILPDGKSLHFHLCGPYRLTQLAPSALVDYGMMGIPRDKRPLALIPMRHNSGSLPPVVVTQPHDLVTSFPYMGQESDFAQVAAEPVPGVNENLEVYVAVYYQHTVLGLQEDELPVMPPT